jgi:hypothetical protein
METINKQSNSQLHRHEDDIHFLVRTFSTSSVEVLHILRHYAISTTVLTNFIKKRLLGFRDEKRRTSI